MLLKTSLLIKRMTLCARRAPHWYTYPGYALLAVRCLGGRIAKIKKQGLAVPSIMPQAASHTLGKELIVIYAHLSLSLFVLFSSNVLASCKYRRLEIMSQADWCQGFEFLPNYP